MGLVVAGQPLACHAGLLHCRALEACDAGGSAMCGARVEGQVYESVSRQSSQVRATARARLAMASAPVCAQCSWLGVVCTVPQVHSWLVLHSLNA